MAEKKTGYGVRITLETSSLTFLEKSVTLPGYDGGDPIDTTNNSKSALREQYPRTLIQTTGATATVEYDPSTLEAIKGAINVQQVITIEFLEGDQVTIYGWLRSFTPSDFAEGAQPTAEIAIESAGVDAAGDEEGIVYSTTTS
jgi:hypothetical protein